MQDLYKINPSQYTYFLRSSNVKYLWILSKVTIHPHLKKFHLRWNFSLEKNNQSKSCTCVIYSNIIAEYASPSLVKLPKDHILLFALYCIRYSVNPAGNTPCSQFEAQDEQRNIDQRRMLAAPVVFFKLSEFSWVLILMEISTLMTESLFQLLMIDWGSP